MGLKTGAGVPEMRTGARVKICKGERAEMLEELLKVARLGRILALTSPAWV